VRWTYEGFFQALNFTKARVRRYEELAPQRPLELRMRGSLPPPARGSACPPQALPLSLLFLRPVGDRKGSERFRHVEVCPSVCLLCRGFARLYLV
jgi:hypothetical protein